MADPIPFKRDLEFEYGRVDQVSPMVRRVIANNPSPFTFTGTGTYIVGQDTVAVIDPGPQDDAHYDALIEALDGKTVSHILVTHTHRDHSPLAARLKQATGAQTLAYGAHGSGRPRSVEMSGDVQLDAGGDRDFAPDIEIRHGDIIEGPGWTFEAVFTPGHTSNHMSFALQEENAMFAGDHVMAWSTSVIAPPDGNMADYMASLDLMLARDEDIYWPTHGPKLEDARAFVSRFISHRRGREEAVVEQLRLGPATIDAMVPEIYKGVDPRLFPAAALSMLAHVEHLIEQGIVETDSAVSTELVSMGSQYRLR